jgi:hypothetical protein
MIKFLYFICDSSAPHVTVLFVVLQVLLVLALEWVLSSNRLPRNHAKVLILLPLSVRGRCFTNTTHIASGLTPWLPSRLRGPTLLISNKVANTYWGRSVHHLFDLGRDHFAFTVLHATVDISRGSMGKDTALNRGSFLIKLIRLAFDDTYRG